MGDKFWGLMNKIQHPLSIIFAAFGGLLILLGLTTGVEIPVLKQLAIDDNSRNISLILGAIFIVLSIVMYYMPIKINDVSGSDFTSKLNNLSPSQRRILDFICENGSHGNIVSQDQVFGKFQPYHVDKGYSESENYYRLEQLHLLGFLDKKKSGKENNQKKFSYNLSSAYEKAIKESEK